jgi:hypothetical protein
MQALSASLLYAPGAFFFFPYKPIVNALIGDTYLTGYKHFRRDHSDATNAALHVVALGLQLSGNFGLLYFADGALVRHFPAAASAFGFGPHFRVLGGLTAAIWATTLLLSPAPILANLLASFCIFLAYLLSPQIVSASSTQNFDLELLAMGAFLAVQVAAGFLLPIKSDARKKGFGEIAKDLAISAALFSLLVGARRACGLYIGRVWADEASQQIVNIALPSLLALIALVPDPVKPVTIAGAFGCRIATELTGQKWLLFYSCAFVGMVLQGRSHDITKQQATLLTIEETVSDKQKKIRFEWAHVTYFPAMLFHSMMQTGNEREEEDSAAKKK